MMQEREGVPVRRWPAALVAALVLLITGAVPARAGAAARGVSRGDSQCRRVALTFDAEIIPDRTRAILAVLARYRARSTFFLTGFSARAYPALTREIAAAHEVGNHTDSHPHLTALDPAGMALEIDDAAAAIAAATGEAPAPLFRPPYGNFDARVLQAAGNLGYPYLVMWSVDPRDWEAPPAEVIAARITAGVRPGGIVVLHGSGAHTAAALELAMAELEDQGYRFTTVSDLLGLAPDQRDPGGSRYVVQNGDTLSEIARCWRVSPAALLAANGIRPGTGVPARRALTIPYADQVTVLLQGERIDLGVVLRAVGPPVAVPLRPLAAALGARLVDSGGVGGVAVQLGWRTLHLRAGSTGAMATGRRITLPQAPERRDPDLWVPLRALGEALGLAVAWDADARTVDLTLPSGAPPAALAPPGPGAGGSRRQ